MNCRKCGKEVKLVEQKIKGKGKVHKYSCECGSEGTVFTAKPAKNK